MFTELCVYNNNLFSLVSQRGKSAWALDFGLHVKYKITKVGYTLVPVCLWKRSAILTECCIHCTKPTIFTKIYGLKTTTEFDLRITLRVCLKRYNKYIIWFVLFII